MEPTGEVPGRSLTRRHARLAIAGVAGAFAIGLLALVVENALVLHRIRRINESGGMVYSYAARLPLWSRLPISTRDWLDEHWVLRADYIVDFDEGPGCGVGVTLMFPRSRLVKPGDEVVAAVRDLGHVRRLQLTNTSVSDASLDDLARLPALESISLCGTRVTEEAATRSPSAAIRHWASRRHLACP